MYAFMFVFMYVLLTRNEYMRDVSSAYVTFLFTHAASASMCSHDSLVGDVTPTLPKRKTSPGDRRSLDGKTLAFMYVAVYVPGKRLLWT